MGRFTKIACSAVIAAMPFGFGASDWSNDAEAIVVIATQFDPSIVIDECPATVRRGERFTIRGTAYPSPGSAGSDVYVAVAVDGKKGRTDRKRSTAIFIGIDNDEPMPFEVTSRASGWSAGIIHVGATIISHDIPTDIGTTIDPLAEPIEPIIGSAVALDECKIQIVRRRKHGHHGRGRGRSHGRD